ncbi:helix-turn-helix transcriptional regulator [Myceligenerans pegani]|uniref:Helix-turn-helix transcriptional regulator n=1 Tax=Myceligenerans pegani TaxID=2776917 RepID=A0ABR9MZ51_9MICO|nr:LuxR family transcriptional regulator [Myceligenerans sp. TRM 65318]MBE1876672.1 helix-turn-helix transcriptional regulator [Myceligenerans sp. TRM 65318]MBE3018943.1 helix-turn-helix transcriptional regulator [Myceligenerans sp. TRM 65318]
MLQGLGMSGAAESVYLQMLRERDAGPCRIAEALGITETEVRDALDELSRLMLVEESWAGDDGYRPVSPEVGLAALLAREQAEVARRNQEIEEGRVALARLVSELRNVRKGPDVEILETAEEARDRLATLTEQCTQELCTFVPTRATSSRALRSSRALSQALLERGVRMRTVYLESIRNDQATWQHATWLRNNGAEVRLAATVPVRLQIIDQDHAMVPLTDTESGSGAVVMTSPGVVAALVALFTQAWRAATPIGADRRRDDDGLSVQELELLRLWAQGATDDAAGRRLGVSLRTVRRLSSGLMERLDASSRFQAGARALDRGWLDPADLS